MIGILSSYLAMAGPFIEEQRDIKRKNQEKLDSLKKAYWEAASLPRKRKKAERKRIVKDYEFWYSLGKWHDEILPFGELESFGF